MKSLYKRLQNRRRQLKDSITLWWRLQGAIGSKVFTHFLGITVANHCLFEKLNPYLNIKESVTPNKVWYVGKPGVAHLRVFGSNAYRLRVAERNSTLRQESMFL